MQKFIAIDPGKHQCGLAKFEAGKLLVACMIKPEELGLFDAEYTRLVIEIPRIYPVARQKGDQNDLIEVAFAAGKCSAFFQEVKRLYPRDWKGTMPKEKMTARIESRLTPTEFAQVLTRGALRHNALDAVGIGLYTLGRL
jgi:hypothetical protein